MKRHKSISHMLRNRGLSFWTPVNFEVEYFLNEETESVLTDTVIYFYDQHSVPGLVNLGWKLHPFDIIFHSFPLILLWIFHSHPMSDKSARYNI